MAKILDATIEEQKALAKAMQQLHKDAAKLTNADLNEESANLLTLQTRQQLGTIGLSIAQSSDQSVLRLFF